MQSRSIDRTSLRVRRDPSRATPLINNATLLSNFEHLYPSATAAQQTSDLTPAYNALANAVTSANITSMDITTINADWSAVLAALPSTSTATATFPYFTLVTGQSAGV